MDSIKELYRLIGYNLRMKRKDLKKTQQMLAEDLNLSVSFLSRIERGKKLPSIETLQEIADILDVNICYFFIDTSDYSVLDSSNPLEDPMIHQILELLLTFPASYRRYVLNNLNSIKTDLIDQTDE